MVPLLLECSLSRVERLLEEGDALFEKEEPDGALEKYRDALALDPESHRAHFSLGVVHYSRQDYPRALEALHRAVELESERAPYLLQRGHTLLRLRRFDEAIRDYEEVIRLDPSRARAYYSVGIAYYNSRDYEKAAHWLRRYLKIAPRAEDRERVQQLILSLEAWSS